MKTELLDIETQNSDWQKIDYRPFGEQSWTATEGVVRRGFGGDIFDIESGFIRMGARLYEPETGRFTSIDPLFEAFKRRSPYSYSYNSPLTFRDPTGLAPEKEKYKDEILDFPEVYKLQEFLDVNQIMMQNIDDNVKFENLMNAMINLITSLDHTMHIVQLLNAIDDFEEAARKARTGEAGSNDKGIIIRFNVKEKNENGVYNVTFGEVKYYQGRLFNSDGSEYSGNNDFVWRVFDYLESLWMTGDPEIVCRLETLENSENKHIISETDIKDFHNTIEDINRDLGYEMDGIPTGSIMRFLYSDMSITSFAHELLGHAYYYDNGSSSQDMYLYDMKEVYAIMIENEVRRYFGYPQRKSTHYDAPLSNEVLKPYWRK